MKLILVLVAGLLALAPLFAATDFVTFQVKELGGVTTADYPVTVSHYFRDGEVGNDLTVKVGGSTVTSQFDVKATYASGYVKHGLITFRVPGLPANGTVNVTLSTRDQAVNNGAGMSRQDFLNDAGFDALFTMTRLGTVYTASARDLITKSTSLKYWLRGPLVTEVLLMGPAKTAAGVADTFMNVQFQVRKYAGDARYYISTVAENCWRDRRGNITYDFTLSYCGNSVLSQSGLLHYNNSRWRKAAWSASALPAVFVKHDFDYWQRAGAFWQYDRSYAIPESELTANYSAWTASDRSLMGGSYMNKYVPSSGDRSEIGPLPLWSACHIVANDPRSFEEVTGMGEIAGHLPMHLRDEDTKQMVSIDKFPQLCMENASISGPDALPAPLHDITTPWSLDNAHHPSLAYLPYILTGEYYFYEESGFWANRMMLTQNAVTGRDYSRGLLQAEQTRGQGWGLRTMAMFANIAADGTWEKSYMTGKVQNNIDFYYDRLVNPATRTNAIGYIGIVGDRDNFIASPWTAFTADNAALFCSPWQEDFCFTTFDLVSGFDLSRTKARAVRNVLGQFNLNRYSCPGFPRGLGSCYQLIVSRKNPATNFTTMDSCLYYTFAKHTDPTSVLDGSYAEIAKAVARSMTRPGNPDSAAAAVNVRWFDSLGIGAAPNPADFVKWRLVPGVEITAKTGETAPLPALRIVTDVLRAATTLTPYCDTLRATGGTAPLAWSLTTGVLPAGLSLDAASGILSGTASDTGTFVFTVSVRDNSGTPLTDARALGLRVDESTGLQNGGAGSNGCEDTRIVSGYSGGTYGWNFGGYQDLIVGDYDPGNTYISRALIKFDLTGLSGVVHSAKLALCKKVAGNSDSLGVYRLVRSWVEGTAVDWTSPLGGASWDCTNNISGNYAGSPRWHTDGADAATASPANSDPSFDRSSAAAAVAHADSAWVLFDITAMVQNWVSGTWKNDGMLIKELGNETAAKSVFHSSEAQSVSVRPKLLLSLTLGIEEARNTTPAVAFLGENSPNPFNPSTVIRYGVPAVSGGFSHVTLSVYDTRGKKVAALFNGMRAPGTHRAVWNGAVVSSGVYFCRMEAKSGNGQIFTAVRKMVMMK